MTVPATDPTNHAALIERYIQIRDHISELEAAHKANIAKFKEAQSKIETFFLTHLNKTQSNSIGTSSGTAFRKMLTSSKVVDWGLTLNFIRENEMWGMLYERVGQKAIEEYLEIHGDLPPGVDLRREYTVQIRRS